MASQATVPPRAGQGRQQREALGIGGGSPRHPGRVSRGSQEGASSLSDRIVWKRQLPGLRPLLHRQRRGSGSLRFKRLLGT